MFGVHVTSAFQRLLSPYIVSALRPSTIGHNKQLHSVSQVLGKLNLLMVVRFQAQAPAASKINVRFKSGQS